MNKFTTISTKDYVPLSHKEEYFHNKYELIKSFLQKEFGDDYANILALPQIRNREVDWNSKYSSVLKRVSNFSKSEQKKVLDIYWIKINKIKKLTSSFHNSNSDEKREWANLLDEAFNSDNNIVFSDGKNIVLLWGWKFNASEENYVPSPIISTVNETEDYSISEPLEEDNPIPVIPPDPIDDDPIVTKSPWYILFLEWIKKFFRRFWWILLLLLILWFLLNLKTCSCNTPIYHLDNEHTIDDDNEYPIDDDKEDPIYDDNEDTIYDDNEDPIDNNEYPEYQNDDGENYIIIDDEEIFEGRPVPIENPEDIIIDDEEGDFEKIIPDRINIAIKRNSKEKSILDLIADLGKEYPELDVIYYSKKSKLLQLKIPIEDRVTLKKEIKEKFKDLNYDLLIWDEVIFSDASRYNKYNDPVFRNSNQRWYFDAINMEDAWNITKGEKDIIIAIVDDGFDINHVDLKDNYYKPYNVYTQDADLTVPWVKIINGREKAFGFHGTHVAGTAAAQINNNIGTAGIAPNCRLMPIQVGDPTTGVMPFLPIIEGILYAINNGANVINLSLGKDFTESPILNMSDSEHKEMINNQYLDEEKFWIEVFEMANEENITIVLAAGNNDILAGIDAMSRSDYSINVASVDDQERKSDFSNYSDIHTIVSAPGGDSGPGKDIYNCAPYNEYAESAGTSMAAPIITAVVALMKSVNPNLTNKQIKEIFQTTGIKKPGNIGPLVQVDKALNEAKSLYKKDEIEDKDNEESYVDDEESYVDEEGDNKDREKESDSIKDFYLYLLIVVGFLIFFFIFKKYVLKK